MPPTIAPDVTPLLNRERNFNVASLPHKSNSPLTVLLLSAIVLLVAIGAWRLFFASPATADRINVVGAARDIPAGCKLGFTSFHFVDIPKQYFKPGMATSSDMLAGRITKTFIAQGEPITIDQLLPNKQGLSPNIGPNERAITLNLPPESLVDHNIYPGDRVDVLVTSTGEAGKKYTKTVCQNLAVLMAAPKEIFLADKLSPEEHNRITLAAIPQDCEKLNHAVEVGKVRLILRNQASREFVALAGAQDSDLLPPQKNPTEPTRSLPPLPAMLPAPPPLPVAEPPAPLLWEVDVFRGSSKETHSFPINK